MSSSPPLFNTITILGPGLIGGSLALAMTERQIAPQLVLWDIDDRAFPEIRTRLPAAELHHGTASLRAAVAHADLIIFAVPVPFMAGLAREIVGHLQSPDVLITDVGSVKFQVIAELEPIFLPNNAPRRALFLGSHPMAGSEKGSFSVAIPDLFPGAPVLLTPTAATPPEILPQLETFWRALGLTPYALSPEEHDHAIAQVSHLPHLLAALLFENVSSEQTFSFASSGFYKSTQLAAANPELWADILFSNRPGMVQALNGLAGQIKNASDLLSEKSENLEERKRQIRKILQNAKDRRLQMVHDRPALEKRL